MVAQRDEWEANSGERERKEETGRILYASHVSIASSQARNAIAKHPVTRPGGMSLWFFSSSFFLISGGAAGGGGVEAK